MFKKLEESKYKTVIVIVHHVEYIMKNVSIVCRKKNIMREVLAQYVNKYLKKKGLLC